MNKKLCALFFAFAATTSLFAQESENEIKNFIWKNADREFSVVSIPDSLKNESAVVLATTIEHSLAYRGKAPSSVFLFHKRIMLLDNAAVTEFSTLNFNDSEVERRARSYHVTGVKIIKPNGKENILDLNKNGVKNDDGSLKDNKIAVPDLAIGDIVDYFSTAKAETVTGVSSETYLFAERYPSLYTKISLQLPKYMAINWLSQNGAPDFTVKETEDDRTYSLTVGYMPKQKDLLWSYKLRSLPVIRYNNYMYEEDEDKPNYIFSKQDLKNNINSLEYRSATLNIGIIEDYFKVNSKTIDKKDKRTLVKEFFYLIRNPLYQGMYFEISNNPIDNDNLRYEDLYYWFRFLQDHDIKFDLVIAPHRDIGTIKEVSSAYHMDYYLMIDPDKGDPIFVGRMTPFLLPNSINYLLEGSQGFFHESKEHSDPTKTDADGAVEATTKEQNSTTVTYTLNLNADNLTLLDARREVSVAGHNKIYHQGMIVTPYDYLVEYDIPKYEVSKSHRFNDALRKYREAKSKFEQRKVQDYAERDKKVKESIESDNEVKIAEYKNFKLVSPGMWEDRPMCEYRDEFSLENVSKKAGPNIIIELPKLIEKQTEVKEEKSRKEDIYMNFARSFRYNFKFTIPDGYTAEGLEALNKKVESETGGFIATAKVEGNVLTIETYKYYNSNYVPADKFSTMFGFLQAAVDFSKQKILLRKN